MHIHYIRRLVYLLFSTILFFATWCNWLAFYWCWINSVWVWVIVFMTCKFMLANMACCRSHICCVFFRPVGSWNYSYINHSIPITGIYGFVFENGIMIQIYVPNSVTDFRHAGIKITWYYNFTRSTFYFNFVLQFVEGSTYLCAVE